MHYKEAILTFNQGLLRFFALTTYLVIPAAAFAQSFPSKPIKVIVPYAAGGAADLMARYLCDKCPLSMGQPCVARA